MKKRMKYLFTIFVCLSILIMPVKAEGKVYKASTFASKYYMYDMYWCTKCPYEYARLNKSFRRKGICPKCGKALKYRMTEYSTINGYGSVAYKVTVPKNKTVWIQFPSRAKAIVPPGYLIEDKKVKNIVYMARISGKGNFIKASKNTAKIKCAKKTKFMVATSNHGVCMIQVNVK